MTTALTYTVIPILAAIIGGFLTLLRRPSHVAVSAIQHFAAGIVFSAAAVEILPHLKHQGALWSIVVGGGLGVAAMLVLKTIGERTEGKIGLVSLIAVDLFIDGTVLGLAFQGGEKAGLLLTFALTIEVLFLALSVAAELGDAPEQRFRNVAITSALALMMPVGVVFSAPFATASPGVVTGAFAFGLVALLYLVTEELLVEAHEVEEPPWATALFFVGFLLLLILEDTL
ncbi:ZIP family metal transporter [Pinisolibacter sp.]|uniref:ZIP family metal transporter n=1 Tax=Pinisolibacter sp. TaxID=2172024 RepID=UPI002FDD988D